MNKKELLKFAKNNLRDYGMLIALVVIITVFTITTHGTFLSSSNINNLINQTGYIAVLAIGITLLIIIRHIDLSIGYVAGFLGAISALLMTKDINWFVAVLVVLVMGILIGSINGLAVAKIGVPAFVVTLGGNLIFRGLLLLATEKTGTILVNNKSYNAIGNGYIADIANIPGIHLLSLIVGALAIFVFIFSQIKDRENKKKYGFEVTPLVFFIAKILITCAAIAFIVIKLAIYNGISYTMIITAVVALIYSFVMNRTKLGRHIYGLGGNPEAAELSGVDVKKTTVIVFASMSFLAAIAGVLYTARLRSASTTAGLGFDMDAIAAAYVGGVSAQGGVGKISGTIIGALAMSSLINGMNLLNTGIHYQYIIRGLILVFAVIFDITSRKARA